MTETEPFPSVLHLAEYLGITLYDWQAKICLKIDKLSETDRGKIAVCAPNEAGKSSRIIALACIRWLERYPAGRVVVTSRDFKQIADQVWPALRQHIRLFPGWRALEGDKRIETRMGGRLRAFTTDDPGRAEGVHQAPGAPLLYVVDEAKSIDPEILRAIDRCSYNVLLYISSPGYMQGPLYEAFTSNRAQWHCFKAGLADCKHISQAKIDDINNTYGVDAPFTRSALHGEFMTTEEGISHLISLEEIEAWRNSQIGLKHGDTVVGCDFACGGDCNVILKRVGNQMHPPIIWRDKNSAAAIGKFNLELHRMGYDDTKHDHFHVFGDYGGPGRPMVDTLRESGIDIIPVNFGAPATEPGFKNMGTQMWFTAIRMIKSGLIVCPPQHQPGSQQLFAQLSSRRMKVHSGGQIWMETKPEMRDRGLPSPDIADAFALAFGCAVPTSTSWLPFDDIERQRIAKAHGWDYTPERDYRPGEDDDSPGFGGVHSTW
jgi:phage terminase large subunit